MPRDSCVDQCAWLSAAASISLLVSQRLGVVSRGERRTDCDFAIARLVRDALLRGERCRARAAGCLCHIHGGAVFGHGPAVILLHDPGRDWRRSSRNVGRLLASSSPDCAS